MNLQLMRPRRQPFAPFSHAARSAVLAVALTAASALVGCATDGAKQPGTGEVVQVPPKSFAAQNEARLDMKSNVVTELHVRDQNVYAYTKNHRVYAMARSGMQIQHTEDVTRGRGALRPPVVLKDFVIYPTNTSLEVYDHRGRKVKSLELDAALRSGAAGVEDNVYVGTDREMGGRLVAVDLDRPYGTARWELMTMGGISATPAIFETIVYAASEDGRVYAVSENRAAVWPLEGGVFVTSGRIIADVKADIFGVYVASTDTKLYCLNRASGKIKWQYFAGRSLTTSPDVTEKMVYQLVPGKGLAAINKTEGEFNREPLWTAANATQFLSEDDNNAYLRRRDNKIVAVDKMSGKTQFVSKGSFDVFGTNTKGDGMIYAATKDGRVLAIRPVLKPGTAGRIVMNFEVQSLGPVLASAER